MSCSSTLISSSRQTGEGHITNSKFQYSSHAKQNVGEITQRTQRNKKNSWLENQFLKLKDDSFKIASKLRPYIYWVECLSIFNMHVHSMDITKTCIISIPVQIIRTAHSFATLQFDSVEIKKYPAKIEESAGTLKVTATQDIKDHLKAKRY